MSIVIMIFATHEHLLQRLNLTPPPSILPTMRAIERSNHCVFFPPDRYFHGENAQFSVMSSQSSDEDDDVIVLRVCSNRHCQGIDDLQFDEETGESFCGCCRDLYARAETEGFRVLLSTDYLALVQLIFSRFDTDKKGYWDYRDWRTFQSMTSHPSPDEIDSAESLGEFFLEEYDITLGGKCGPVVTVCDLENMYGGYIYNHIDALVEDSEALEEEGVINTEVLE